MLKVYFFYKRVLYLYFFIIFKVYQHNIIGIYKYNNTDITTDTIFRLSPVSRLSIPIYYHRTSDNGREVVPLTSHNLFKMFIIKFVSNY